MHHIFLTSVLLVFLLGLAGSGERFPPSETGTLQGACFSYFDSTLQKTVYSVLDEPPVFHRGQDTFRMEMIKRMQSYEIREKSNLRVKLFIDPDGNPLKAELAHKSRLCGDCIVPGEKEVIETLMSIGKWKPGKCNGSRVYALLVIPVYLR